MFKKLNIPFSLRTLQTRAYYGDTIKIFTGKAEIYQTNDLKILATLISRDLKKSTQKLIN